MKGILWVDEYYLSNEIFNKDNKYTNRDDCLYHFYLLKEELKKLGIDIVTQDLMNINDADFVIFNDIPYDEARHSVRVNFNNLNHKNMILIIWESEIIKPQNWTGANGYHRKFRKVLSWWPNWGEKKYVQYYWPQKFKEPKLSLRDGFCCLVSSNKMNYDYRELYTERNKLYEWFNENHPGELVRYGFGFNPVETKEVMANYNFAICFENAKCIEGYVTEKIWDCFWKGCIPVYWGAPDINKYIPKNCFIDYRNFNSLDDLYEHMQYIDVKKYRENIAEFLKTDMAKRFSSENFVKTVIDLIVK